MLEQNELLGTTLKAIYAGTPYAHLMYDVDNVLKASNKIRNKNEAILTNLKRVVELVTKSIADLKNIVKEREDARVFFDHYRVKIQNLGKKQSSDPKKKE